MDNFGIDKTPPGKDLNEPIPFDNDTSGASVSHSPLDLGGGGKMEAPKIERPTQPVGAAAKKPAEKINSAERITGVRTFFTKLHAGAIEFLDEVITKWLKDNPGISIKRINMVTGEIQGKKTEPNIIITVWY
jgi:DNA-binding Lrp family transcriptional regulator